MKLQLLKRLLRYSRPYIGYLIFAMLAAVISVSLTLYAPIVIGDAINLILAAGNVDFAGLVPHLITLAVVAAGAALFQWLMNWCTNKLTFNTIKDIRDEAFEKLQSVPLRYIDATAHGDLISRMVNDVDQISDGLLQGFTQLFSGVVTIVGTILFMLNISPPIAAVVVVITPLSLFVASFIAKRSYKMFREQAEIKGELGGYIEEMVSGVPVVRAFGYEQRAQEDFEEINSRLHKVGVKAQFYSSLTNPCTRFVNGVVYAAVGITGAISVFQFGWLSVGQLTAFLQYANQYTKPFNEISGVITELQSALASARRVFSLLDEVPEPPEPADAIRIESCRGEVSIRDVAFAYQPEKPLIEGLNLNVKPGQRIAIVGPTGCGKTTIINLLMRFYDADAGVISIDGTDIRNLARDNLRNQYGMVLQDTWLFAGTIRDNIAYGREDASEAEIIQAAKLAHAHSFIRRLPHGYDTVISEDGGNISAGQKQLLCIARIMLTQPPMLILDEATSSIDTRTEVRIQKAFQKMMEGRTSFIVAHRLSTIREADCILVMDSGHIIEMGTHEELLNKNGFYAKLYNSQFAPAAGSTTA